MLDDIELKTQSELRLKKQTADGNFNKSFQILKYVKHLESGQLDVECPICFELPTVTVSKHIFFIPKWEHATIKIGCNIGMCPAMWSQNVLHLLCENEETSSGPIHVPFMPTHSIHRPYVPSFQKVCGNPCNCRADSLQNFFCFCSQYWPRHRSSDARCSNNWPLFEKDSGNRSYRPRSTQIRSRR